MLFFWFVLSFLLLLLSGHCHHHCRVGRRSRRIIVITLNESNIKLSDSLLCVCVRVLFFIYRFTTVKTFGETDTDGKQNNYDLMSKGKNKNNHASY